MKWYILQVKPNCAHVASRNLARQGFNAFIPTEDVTIRRSGKFSRIRRLIFPGYAFIELNPIEGPWRAVNSTTGVARLVRFGLDPVSVPIEIIDELQRRLAGGSRTAPPQSLTPGQSVRVTQGPFVDFVGQVFDTSPDERIWVLLELLGGQTRVLLNQRQLQVSG